jgi:hypothetical protein
LFVLHKYIIIYILCLRPELIEIISIYNDDFPEILINTINTIKLKDENDEKVDYLFNYLVNKDLKHTVKLFNIIDQKHYREIDEKHYNKLKNFIEKHPNYNKLPMEDFFNYKIK